MNMFCLVRIERASASWLRNTESGKFFKMRNILTKTKQKIIANFNLNVKKLNEKDDAPPHPANLLKLIRLSRLLANKLMSLFWI